MLDYQYLLHLIYCAVKDTAPQEKPEEVSFENVFLLGKEHEVANIAFLSVEKLKTKPEETLYDDWKLYYYFSAQRDSRQWAVRDAFVSELHKNGIRTLEAQGTVTKLLYPSPELRMMSDIDFVIDPENADKVQQLAESMGYSIFTEQPGEFAAIKDKEYVEFHTDFFTEFMYNRRERYSDALKSPFDFARADGEDKLSFYLEDTYFYLYSVLHIIKHFETAGCGIRRVLDLYYLKKAYENKIDKTVVDSVIDEGGFRESYNKLFALEGVWFEDIPTELDLSETVYDVINSGNHGREAIFTRNNVRKDEKEGVRFAKAKRIASFLFPDKEYIYLNYPECRERNYSTARTQLYRIGKKLKGFNISHAVDHIKTIIKTR